MQSTRDMLRELFPEMNAEQLQKSEIILRTLAANLSASGTATEQSIASSSTSPSVSLSASPSTNSSPTPVSHTHRNSPT